MRFPTITNGTSDVRGGRIGEIDWIGTTGIGERCVLDQVSERCEHEIEGKRWTGEGGLTTVLCVCVEGSA